MDNTHDNLGQLKQKKVGGALQTVDYTYNIRGWLKGINNEGGSNAAITLGSGDLFGFQMNYNTPNTGAGLFNGNIRQTLWKTTNVNNTTNLVSNQYTYSYDALNRITGAIDNTTNYNVSNIGYDKNGNITGLQRKGVGGLIDNLSYNYHDSEVSNKLKRVTDASNNIAGFKDGANQTEEYTYDANGNMVTDKNKGITAITYNHLNLPTLVSIGGGTISYLYDATGVKQRKVVSTGTTTDYAGNYVYEKPQGGTETLQFFRHAEGYVSVENGSYKYVYEYKDHLGNTRLSYTDANGNGSIDVTSNPLTTEIVKESNYYPFGLEHQGYNSNINGVENDYEQFQGQEWTEDLSLNIHEWKYRISDPAIGKFWQVDPLAEDYSYQSPYNFSENRLIDSRELEGLERIFAADGKFINQIGDSQEIRVLQNTDGTSQAQTLINTANNTELSSEERTAASSALRSNSFHGFESTKDAATSFARAYNVASMEANDGAGQEFGAAINTVTLSNADGIAIDGTTNNTVAVMGSKVGGDGESVSASTMLNADNIKFGSGEYSTLPGKLAAFVHTHGQGSNTFSGFDATGGGRGDLQISADKGIPVFMSNKIGQLRVLDYNGYGNMANPRKGVILDRFIPISKKK